MLGQEAVEQERSLTFEVRLYGYRSLSLDEKISRSYVLESRTL